MLVHQRVFYGDVMMIFMMFVVVVFLGFLLDLACRHSGVGIMLKISLNIPSGKLT